GSARRRISARCTNRTGTSLDEEFSSIPCRLMFICLPAIFGVFTRIPEECYALCHMPYVICHMKYRISDDPRHLPPLSLVSKRLHGIQSCRPPRRNVTGQQRHYRQQ